MTREFLMQWRESLLQLLDTIERELGVSPRTSELRRAARQEKTLQRRADGELRHAELTVSYLGHDPTLSG